MFHKILVAIDRSPLGEHIFGKALALAKALEAELMILHVLSADESGSPQIPVSATGLMTNLTLEAATFEIYQKQWQEFEAQGLAFLQSHTQIATEAGVKTEFTQTPGYPGRVICELAKNWSSDLIVVGRRGTSGLSELFLGSVSNYVLHHAPCEVLVVHAPQP
ncbi:MAG: universal stress protein [Oscillatoriophycideae cyanobacterium NC_groundwater_1537_Pr4_S-0.65um_50_18]|nr:universal stress protein [Oscillatoriophycideae cyanobacterium NC_groundwater_1537_Pr4_S-0.65um_50_18]